jgi:hypothetical protein
MFQVARIATGSQFNTRSAPIPRKGFVLTLAATWWVYRSHLGIGFGQKALTGVSYVCHTVDRRGLYARELGNWVGSLCQKPLWAGCLCTICCTVCSASIAR